MKVAVTNWQNGKAGDIELDAGVFGLPLRADILHRVVEWQRAKARAGTHKTKEIGEISGGGKKPYKQKGTGNARQGSTRSPQFRGGATIFGPVVRSHAYDLPKKIRKLGLKTALSAKASAGKLLVIESGEFAKAKTKDLKDSLNKMGLVSVLVIDGDNVNENLLKAANNLPYVDVLPQIGANVLDILKHDNLVITKDAIKKLEERLK